MSECVHVCECVCVCAYVCVRVGRCVCVSVGVKGRQPRLRNDLIHCSSIPLVEKCLLQEIEDKRSEGQQT